jgi:hypothetical protein
VGATPGGCALYEGEQKHRAVGSIGSSAPRSGWDIQRGYYPHPLLDVNPPFR